MKRKKKKTTKKMKKTTARGQHNNKKETTQRTQIFLCAVLIVLLGALAYANSFQGVFLLDDNIRILDNERIHSLAGPWTFFQNTRRPILYLSLALNYAWSGREVWSYHLVNLTVHLLAALLLFGLVRRTLLLPRFQNAFDRDALGLACLTAIVWVVHPLQTQSVTYVTQRAESLTGMLYFLTVYAAVRNMSLIGPSWLGVAGLACLLGGLTKEVIVTAPAVILLYDRAFVSRSFKEALTQHKKLYTVLAVPVAVMFYLLWTVHPVEVTPTAGFSYTGITPWQYALTQPEIILHYLKLSVWPHPLVLDYAWPAVQNFSQALPALLGVVALLVFGLWHFWRTRTPGVGFLILTFFIILSPSSSFIPLKDLAFEHRMYLPLACVVVLALLGVRKLLLGAISEQKLRKSLAVGLSVLVVGLLGFLTFERNKDYRDGLTMWGDVVTKRPNNARALNNLGWFLFNNGQTAEAESYFQKSLALNPDARAHTDFGNYLMQKGEKEEAVQYFKKALAIDPEYADAYLNLGISVAREGHYKEAVQYYLKVVEFEPDYAVAYNNLGGALADQGLYTDAIPYYAKSIEKGFYDAGVYHNLGIAYALTGQPEKAVKNIRKALQINPDLKEAQVHLKEIEQNVQRLNQVQ